MNAEEWDGKEDLKGWWISEKMDGIRAFWNGDKLISRRANSIACPSWFVDGLPKGTKLDGELWMGRKNFEKTLLAINSAQNESLWKLIKYVVFDMVVSSKP